MQDSRNAEITLLKKVPEFGYQTCVQMATAFSNIEVIAHPCFQSVVTNIWYHDINPEMPSFYVT
jgi:hypothetical protein